MGIVKFYDRRFPYHKTKLFNLAIVKIMESILFKETKQINILFFSRSAMFFFTLTDSVHAKIGKTLLETPIPPYIGGSLLTLSLNRDDYC